MRSTHSTELGRHRRPSAPAPGLLSVPVALREAMTRPGRRAVAGLLLVLVLAALLLGARVAMARAAATPRPAALATTPAGLISRSVPSAFVGTGGQAAATGAATPSSGPGRTSAVPSLSTGQATGSPNGQAAASPSSQSAAAGTGAAVGAGATTSLVVDVVGQVRRPGVVHLPQGSRVLDAVAAAGGALRSAQTSAINLARPLVDGEQILIPKPGQSPMAAGVPPLPQGGSSPGSGPAVMVDLNSADATALDALPGVGPVLAQRILDWRTQHGRFSTVDELGEVSGIGDKLLAQIGPHVRV